MTSYYIEARKDGDNKWHQFTGTIRKQTQHSIDYFQNHIDTYFNKMDYNFRLVIKEILDNKQIITSKHKLQVNKIQPVTI